MKTVSHRHDAMMKAHPFDALIVWIATMRMAILPRLSRQVWLVRPPPPHCFSSLSSQSTAAAAAAAAAAKAVLDEPAKTSDHHAPRNHHRQHRADPTTTHPHHDTHHASLHRKQQQGIAILEASVENHHPSSSSDHHGGRCTTKTTTHLTKVSHRSPLRLVPCRASSVAQAGAAICYQASYGGGVVRGDELRVEVTVHPGATLGLLTQGNTRVFPPTTTTRTTMAAMTRADTTTTSTTTTTTTPTTRLHATYTLEADSLFVVAPDPLVALPGAQLEQVSSVYVNDATASCVVIDWMNHHTINATRTKRHDTTFNPLSSLLKTQLRCYACPEKTLQLVDAMVLQDNNLHMHTQLQSSFDSVASMLVTGPRTRQVVEQCRRLQALLMKPYARVRVLENEYYNNNEEVHGAARNSTQQSTTNTSKTVLESLSGRVVLGMTRVNWKHENPMYLLRWAAQSNQDLYRCFHYCLQPLGQEFGLEFYKDRIRAAKSAIMPTTSTKTTTANVAYDTKAETAIDTTAAAAGTDTKILPIAKHPTPTTYSPLSMSSTSTPLSWTAYILADSALPVGSFAHSAGLEAASQLGLLLAATTADTASLGTDSGYDRLAAFIQASTRSIVQGSVTFIIQSHRLATNALSHNVSNFDAAWGSIDRQAHAFLVGNGPACRASLDQGRSLLRVVSQWIQTTTKSVDENEFPANLTKMMVLQQLQARIQVDHTMGHFSTVFGTMTALLELSDQEACELFGFCVARDMVSAAVRLNLLGPNASVPLLSQAHTASHLGNETGRKLVDEAEWAGAGCSPMLEAIQPCHDVLAMRLFRT